MDLQEFVAQTLIQISEGVATARAKKKGNVAPPIELGSNVNEKVFFTSDGGIAHLVAFDVAVTVTDKTTAGGGAGIQVVSFLNIGGDKTKAVESSSISRVRFEVPISYSNNG